VKKEIQICFIPFHDQLANVFTKSLPTAPFIAFWFKLKVDPPLTFCKSVDTPISTSKVTILPDPLFSNPTQFRQIMGAL